MKRWVRWIGVIVLSAFLSPPGLTMNIARDKSISGANYVEGIAGYLGAGVRGEVMDTNLYTEHQAFQSTPILHGEVAGINDHGTKVYGIVFGDGTDVDEELAPGAKGVIPQAQGIFADYCRLIGSVLAHAAEQPDPGCSGEDRNEQQVSRYCHTCELVKPGSQCTDVCPPAPYSNPGDLKAVFQSNSWSIADDTLEYTNHSQAMDDILFRYDLLACQAQGNDGANTPVKSKPEAWAKNIVSVGGVFHNNNLDKDDDVWNHSGSIGPASDQRIKPDFTHFFDHVYTTDSSEPYIADFHGTSAATPITCGHFGLFFQMWADAIFGNTLLDPNCNPEIENCVFKNRSHMTTAKAMMINTASPYPFVGSAESVDLTRTHQGWGLVQVGRLHILRSRFPVIIDETRLLNIVPPNNSALYTVVVPANTYALRATLVYADPRPDIIAQSRQAVNNLNLKVTAPNLTTVYWGNCGLREGNWSSSACIIGDHPFLNSPTTEVIDTVENVFIQNPVNGTWRVRVIAQEIMADGHTETFGPDADFALVVSIDPDCNQNGRSDADDILDPSPTGSPDCDEDGIPDECDSGGACCLSHESDDCIKTPTSDCCDAAGGIQWYGLGTKCRDIDCFLAPSGPQGP